MGGNIKSSNNEHTRCLQTTLRTVSKSGDQPDHSKIKTVNHADVRETKKNSSGDNGQGSSSLHTAHQSSFKENSTNSFKSVNQLWWLLFFCVCVASFGTRLYKIDQPDHICWDETHFGKMGSWYINRTFFFDVHPPLGKMLIGLSGYWTGYDGSFHFSKPGDKYNDTHYIGMRVVCASLGACIPPLAFSITWHLSKSCGAATLAAAFIILDTGVLTLSQYILLDPILMVMIMLATWSLLKFCSYKHRCFSIIWWFWLFSTGFFLACSISVKFVGLFVVLFAGTTVAWDLWCMLGDLSISMVLLTKHFIARSLGLIVFPTIIYLIYFAIHFSILNKSGNGDGFFSSAFQSQLQGNALYNASMPASVAYGSIVTIKNHRTAGAYLHSHPHLYPEGIGARQQQVTTYSHKDENNKWRIKAHDREWYEGDRVLMVKDGDMVRLEHTLTQRNLHSHKEMAPLSRQQYQVTCYGENGTGDINDIFRIDVVGGQKGETLKTVRSVFRVIHYTTGCALHSHNKQLPKWGWEQLEVTCNPQLMDKRSLWNIEEVIDSRLPNSSFEVYAPGFVEKLIESHAVMTQGNKNMKSKEGEVTSQPWQWPLNYKGQPFSGNEYRIYLLGNPVIWWLNLTVLVLFILYGVTQLVRRQRYPQHSLSAGVERVLYGCGWLLIGWTLHYVPFWTMTRVLYFHHYFPAFLYSCMISGIFIDHVVKATSQMLSIHAWSTFYSASLCALVAVLVSSFVMFSPLSYGMHGPVSQDTDSSYKHLKWLSTWDI